MIRDFGERALLVELDHPDHPQALAVDLQREPVAGVEAVIPALRSVLLELEPAALDRASEIRDAIADRLESLAERPVAGRTRTIPVVYGGEHGPDLLACAELSGLAPTVFAERHAAVELRVRFCGFAPGFAYLGELPRPLHVHRLDTPRTHTPPGSVAVAGPMTGIYPADLPGGWRIIGRTPLALFDARRDPPTYLAPGDVVRFTPVAEVDWATAPRAADDW